MWKGAADSKTTKLLSKNETKKQLLEPIIINEVAESKELNNEAEEINCERLIFKLCERYPKLLRSSIGLGLFKNYHKDIKTVCRENEEDFR